MFEMEDTPFKNRAHDLSLAQSICQGARPELSPWAPEFYRIVYKRCVDPDPDKRPSVHNLAFNIDQWNQDRNGEYIPALERARNMLKNHRAKLTEKPAHPEAVYFSRVFNFESLRINVDGSAHGKALSNNRSFFLF